MSNHTTIFGRANIRTGTYTGDGVADRNINVGADLLHKPGAYVIVKCYYSYEGVHRIEYGQGDETMTFYSNSDSSDRITGFTSTGFTVYDSDECNTNGYLYRYIAFWRA